jgi:hypothetical protein
MHMCPVKIRSTMSSRSTRCDQCKQQCHDDHHNTACSSDLWEHASHDWVKRHIVRESMGNEKRQPGRQESPSNAGTAANDQQQPGKLPCLHCICSASARHEAGMKADDVRCRVARLSRSGVKLQ